MAMQKLKGREKEDVFNDPIKLTNFDQSGMSFGDCDLTDTEIIDYGYKIDHQEYDLQDPQTCCQSSTNSVSAVLPHTPIDVNRIVSVKLVDCIKFPNYKKRKRQIENESESDLCPELENRQEVTNTKEQSSTENANALKRLKKLSEINIGKVVHKEEKFNRINLDNSYFIVIPNDRNRNGCDKIDFKKNKGLVGLSIKRNIRIKIPVTNNLDTKLELKKCKLEKSKHVAKKVNYSIKNNNHINSVLTSDTVERSLTPSSYKLSHSTTGKKVITLVKPRNEHFDLYASAEYESISSPIKESIECNNIQYPLSKQPCLASSVEKSSSSCVKDNIAKESEKDLKTKTIIKKLLLKPMPKSRRLQLEKQSREKDFHSEKVVNNIESKVTSSQTIILGSRASMSCEKSRELTSSVTPKVIDTIVKENETCPTKALDDNKDKFFKAPTVDIPAESCVTFSNEIYPKLSKTLLVEKSDLHKESVYNENNKMTNTISLKSNDTLEAVKILPLKNPSNVCIKTSDDLLMEIKNYLASHQDDTQKYMDELCDDSAKVCDSIPLNKPTDVSTDNILLGIKNNNTNLLNNPQLESSSALSTNLSKEINSNRDILCSKSSQNILSESHNNSTILACSKMKPVSNTLSSKFSNDMNCSQSEQVDSLHKTLKASNAVSESKWSSKIEFEVKEEPNEIEIDLEKATGKEDNFQDNQIITVSQSQKISVSQSNKMTHILPTNQHNGKMQSNTTKALSQIKPPNTESQNVPVGNQNQFKSQMNFPAIQINQNNQPQTYQSKMNPQNKDILQNNEKSNLKQNNQPTSIQQNKQNNVLPDTIQYNATKQTNQINVVPDMIQCNTSKQNNQNNCLPNKIQSNTLKQNKQNNVLPDTIQYNATKQNNLNNVLPDKIQSNTPKPNNQNNVLPNKIQCNTPKQNNQNNVLPGKIQCNTPKQNNQNNVLTNNIKCNTPKHNNQNNVLPGKIQCNTSKQNNVLSNKIKCNTPKQNNQNNVLPDNIQSSTTKQNNQNNVLPIKIQCNTPKQNNQNNTVPKTNENNTIQQTNKNSNIQLNANNNLPQSSLPMPFPAHETTLKIVGAPSSSISTSPKTPYVVHIKNRVPVGRIVRIDDVARRSYQYQKNSQNPRNSRYDNQRSIFHNMFAERQNNFSRSPYMYRPENNHYGFGNNYEMRSGISYNNGVDMKWFEQNLYNSINNYEPSYGLYPQIPQNSTIGAKQGGLIKNINLCSPHTTSSQYAERNFKVRAGPSEVINSRSQKLKSNDPTTEKQKSSNIPVHVSSSISSFIPGNTDAVVQNQNPSNDKDVHKNQGYSPAILPIPAYDICLSRVELNKIPNNCKKKPK